MPGLLSKTNTLHSIRNMDPYEFEELVADLWEGLGFETHVRSGSGDRGIDVEAARPSDRERKELVQVKRYSANNKLGSQKIREYATLYQQVSNAAQVTIVTSGYFTTEAERLADDLDIFLVDADDLFQLVDSQDEVAVQYLSNPQGISIDDEKTRASKVKSYSMEESPFSTNKDIHQINPDQTHFDTCPECGRQTVWFAKIEGNRHLKCGSCSAAWRKIEEEKSGWILTKRTIGWKEYQGPNAGDFKSKEEWTN